MRLIDADSIKYHRTKECGGHGVFLDVDMVYKEEVDAIPTIGPESLRPHGRWVCVNLAYGRYECSVCHTADEDCSDYYGAHNVTGQDFCPNCGAKMDGGEENAAD